jgi:hypothetical protein
MLRTLEIDELKRVLDVPIVILELIISYFDDYPLQLIVKLHVPDADIFRVDNSLYNCYEHDNKRIYTKLFDTDNQKITNYDEQITCGLDEFILSIKYRLILKNAIYCKYYKTISCDDFYLYLNNIPIYSYFPKKRRHIKIHTIILYGHKLYFNTHDNTKYNNTYKLFRFNIRTHKLYYIMKYSIDYFHFIGVSDNYIYMHKKINSGSNQILAYNKKNLNKTIITHHLDNIAFFTDSCIYGKNNDDDILKMELILDKDRKPIDVIDNYSDCGFVNNVCGIISERDSSIIIYKIKF